MGLGGGATRGRCRLPLDRCLLRILLSEKVNYISRGLLYRPRQDLLFKVAATVFAHEFLFARKVRLS